MTPAETLEAAADVLEEWADNLPGAPWEVEKTVDHPDFFSAFAIFGAPETSTPGSEEVVGTFDDATIAQWVSAWSPGLGRMLAEFLRDLAQDAREMAADMRAVALAEVILVALNK